MSSTVIVMIIIKTHNHLKSTVCYILSTVCYIIHSVLYYPQCAILSTVCYIIHSVLYYPQCAILSTLYYPQCAILSTLYYPQCAICDRACENQPSGCIKIASFFQLCAFITHDPFKTTTQIFYHTCSI